MRFDLIIEVRPDIELVGYDALQLEGVVTNITDEGVLIGYQEVLR